MGIVKINTLTINQLKTVLAQKNLPTKGNRSELIQRLLENTETDEVNVELVEQHDETVCKESEMNDLKEGLSKLSQAVAVLSQQFSTICSTLNNTTTRQSLSSSEHQSTSSSSPQQVGQPPTPAVTRGTNFRSPDRINVNHMTPSEMCDIIPIFDPTNELSPSPEQFVQRVNHLKELYHWDERKVLVVAQMKMKGAAKQWCDSMLESHNTWQDFSNALIEDFGGCDNEADIHFKMVSTVRNNGERVIDYFYRMRALGRKYGLSDAAIIRYIRNGLKHNDLQSSLATINFLSLNELRSAIERYMKNRPPIARHEMKYPRNNTKPDSSQASLTKASVKNSSPIICYNCFESGHLSINCPKPQRRVRCTICLKTTHPEAQCPEKGKLNNRHRKRRVQT